MTKNKIIILITTVFFVCFNLGGMDQGTNLPKFSQPILITSAGQSAEVQLANVLAKRAGLSVNLIKTATEKDLQDIKTIALVLGASLKGLGAAGLDMEQEKSRVNDLLETAKTMNLPVICLHLGGDSRRGQLTDELITSCLPHAKITLVVKTGNKDNLFTKICSENDIPLIEVERTADVLQPLKDLFQ